MIDDEAINYLENLEVGNFLTLNIPIYSGEFLATPVIYLGKDDEDRYIFEEHSSYKISKDFLKRNNIFIDADYDRGKAYEIIDEVKKRMKNKKNRDAR